jgi:hypothetical protein
MGSLQKQQSLRQRDGGAPAGAAQAVLTRPGIEYRDTSISDAHEKSRLCAKRRRLLQRPGPKAG